MSLHQWRFGDCYRRPEGSFHRTNPEREIVVAVPSRVNLNCVDNHHIFNAHLIQRNRLKMPTITLPNHHVNDYAHHIGNGNVSMEGGIIIDMQL